jgi:hypothetical protein
MFAALRWWANWYQTGVLGVVWQFEELGEPGGCWRALLEDKKTGWLK